MEVIMKLMIKKIGLLGLGLCLYSLSWAQGIIFEQDKSWKEVLAIAKKEGKPIFVDAYTTWCAPCKQMDREVFPLAEVGAFYNGQFVNYKLQMDKTSQDTDAIKARYSDAEWFEKTYHIRSYPCYLFFDTQGNLIHQSGGGNLTGSAFVTIGQDALNPASTLANMHKLYTDGNRSADFIMNYLQKLAGASDPSMEAVADSFISSQADPFSLEAVEVMMYMTYSTESPYFKLLFANSDKFIKAKGKEKATSFFTKVIDAGIMGRAMQTHMDGLSGQPKVTINEQGLYSYFAQFYSEEEARLLTDFNMAKYSKLFDPEQSYKRAHHLMTRYSSERFTLSQRYQLASMVLRDGSNPADVDLVYNSVKHYADLEEFTMLQLFCKLHHFKGEQEKSWNYAERAMAQLQKNRPEYVPVSAKEFVDKAVLVMPTPKVMTN